MAFHQALIEEPQHPYVVLTFASVLYYQSWEDGLEFARKSGQRIVNFEPETLDPSTFISVNEVARKVDDLAKKVIDSSNMLVDTDGLHQTMLKYPDFPCSGLVSDSSWFQLLAMTTVLKCMNLRLAFQRWKMWQSLRKFLAVFQVFY